MVQIKERIDKNIFSQVLTEFYFVDELVQFLDTPELKDDNYILNFRC